MDGSCLANASSSHCLASIYNIYSVCVAEASSYSEIAQASSYSYADRALELGKSAGRSKSDNLTKILHRC